MVELVPTGQLLIVNDISGIESAFSRMVEAPEPGFQIGAEVDLDESLQVLEALMHVYDPAFDFNEIAQVQNAGTVPKPHLDNKYLSGIALHHNISGTGIADLQLVEPSVKRRGLHDIETAITVSDLVGPCLRGELMPDMKTVFSQLIFDMQAQAIVLGAAYHSFGAVNENALPREYRRYAHMASPR